jgi:hypothetical protein
MTISKEYKLILQKYAREYRKWDKKYGKAWKKAVDSGDVVAMMAIKPPPPPPPPPPIDP